MRLLPHWVLTDKNPAFYDSESASAIVQTAKLYAAMQELITEYNAFVDEVNNSITVNEKEVNDKIECFKSCVAQTIKNHITVIDTKMENQDKVIADAVRYMKDNIYTTTYDVVEDMFKSGLVKLQTNYDAANEALTLALTTEEG